MEEKQLKYYKMHHDLRSRSTGENCGRGIVCLLRTNWRLLIR